MDIEFRLFGSLTVRQFGYVAVTFILALVVYFIGLPGILSIPIIFFTVVLGLAMTFLEVNGMPFTRWFGNFVTSLFTPQRKVYHKKAIAPDVLTSDFTTAKPSRGKLVKKEESLEVIRALEQEDNADEVIEPGSSVTAEVQQESAGLADVFAGDRLESIDKYFSAKANESLQEYGIETADSVPAQNSQPNSMPATTSVEEAQSPAVKVISRLSKNQIAGFVVDINNSPIPRASILVTRAGSDELLRSAYSDNNGKFIITSPLESGSYRLEIKANNLTFPQYSLELVGEEVPMYRYVAN